MREAWRDGLPAVIARPGLVYGPGDLHLLGFFRSILRRRFRRIGRRDVWLHPIYIDDLTEGLILCGRHPAARRRVLSPGRSGAGGARPAGGGDRAGRRHPTAAGTHPTARRSSAWRQSSIYSRIVLRQSSSTDAQSTRLPDSRARVRRQQGPARARVRRYDRPAHRSRPKRGLVPPRRAICPRGKFSAAGLR